MKPTYLYIENFLCYDITELDLSSITAALIIGKNNDNDNISNGVGKSTVYRAIEYVLFNEARNLNLEEIIRDDTNSCKVIFDFSLGDKIWRVSRSRTRKGVSDLTLYERSDYEEDGVNPHTLLSTDSKFKLFWTDKSSRRTADTEKDLEKLIKTNYKAFSNAFLFAQNDFTSGLANITASKRRAFFRESLPMGIYSKLEKLAKDKSSALLNELEKKKAVRDNFPDLEAELFSLIERRLLAVNAIAEKQGEIKKQEDAVSEVKNKVFNLNTQYTTLQAQLSSILDKKRLSEDRVKRLESSLAEATQKRKYVVENAKSLALELKALKENEQTLVSLISSFEETELVSEKIAKARDEIAALNAKATSLKNEIVELEIPLPDDAVCKHCRQPLTDEHRRTCESEIQEKKLLLQATSTSGRDAVVALKELESQLKTIESKKKELENTSQKIIAKEKEIADKRALFDDYSKMLEKQKDELQVAKDELDVANKEVDASNEKVVKDLKATLDTENMSLRSAEKLLFNLNQELSRINTEISIIDDNLKKNESSKKQKLSLQEDIYKLEEEYSIYPDIIQSFSSTGIPNQIIQSLLDTLQVEANKILSQIKPSLQLAFSITKTTGKGTEDDDLDIKYFYNNKSRSFGAISGAMQLSVMFALKLGYAFLLQKTLGTDIKFLMLDEVDMPLDKASIDALADIIKYFQQDFTVMIISHNDRSKEKIGKFSSVILVEQDQNMISRAKIVS